MRRRTMLLVALSSCLGILAGPPARACCKAFAFAPIPVPDRVALADSIVLGTVVAVEPRNVAASPYPGAPEKVEYQIAVIKIETVVRGVQGITHVRVGFLPHAMISMPGLLGDADGVRRETLLVQGAISPLTIGLRGCFFLTAHGQESFALAPGIQDVLAREMPNFDKDMELTRDCVKLLDDPNAGLRAKEAVDRFLTASMLVTRYRSLRTPTATKTEPIDAEQSRLILEVLAEANWQAQDLRTLLPAPQVPFSRLGLTEKDGYKVPAQGFKGNDYIAFNKAWLKNNAGSYRIQRFVSE